MIAAAPYIGPLQRTVWALRDAEIASRFRKRRTAKVRKQILFSDALVDLIEDCRLRSIPLVPAQVWGEIVHFVGTVDTNLRDQLGINRQLDHVNQILFEVQRQLFAKANKAAVPQLAPIIPLFPR